MLEGMNLLAFAGGHLDFGETAVSEDMRSATGLQRPADFQQETSGACAVQSADGLGTGALTKSVTCFEMKAVIAGRKVLNKN